MDVVTLVRRSVREHASAVAVEEGSRRRTYAELDDRARRLGNGLRALGLRPGDSVAVLLANRIEYPEIDLGIAYGDLVRVALNARLGLDHHGYVMQDAQARVLITEAAHDDVGRWAEEHGLVWIRLGGNPRPSAGAVAYEAFLEDAATRPPGVDGDPARTAWISYTSGTTGKPKGVVLSHRALVQVAVNLHLETGPIEPGRRVILPQPLSHGAGFFVLPYLQSGGTIAVMSRFDPEQARVIGRRDGRSLLKVVPPMLSDLVAEDVPSPFDTVMYGAAPVSSSLLERALDQLGPSLVQVYGQMEAPVTITALRRADHARPGVHRASAGRAWRTVRLAIVDGDGNTLPPGAKGEVLVAGPHLMNGYHNLPQLTREVLRDGWLSTRDQGALDEDGYLYLYGRRDDIINSGGFSIAPKEVENVLDRHPAVAECVAAGMPDERWGQTVRVFVRLVAGAQVSGQDLIDFCRPQLGFRRPRSVQFVNAMPVTAYGKVDRAMLMALDAPKE